MIVCILNICKFCILIMHWAVYDKKMYFFHKQPKYIIPVTKVLIKFLCRNVAKLVSVYLYLLLFFSPVFQYIPRLAGKFAAYCFKG